VHGLLSGTASLNVESLEAAWELGFATIRMCDPSRRGARYLAKGVITHPDNWDKSRRLPPLLTGG
jgi:hypothetical protein